MLFNLMWIWNYVLLPFFYVRVALHLLSFSFYHPCKTKIPKKIFIKLVLRSDIFNITHIAFFQIDMETSHVSRNKVN